MKGLFTVSLISVFAAIAVFGVFMMDHGGQSHSGCIAATANGALCPEGNALASIAFHLNAFKNFSTAIFASSIAALFILALALAYFLRLPAGLCANSFSEQRYFSNSFGEQVYPARKYILRWLALHENSPSLI